MNELKQKRKELGLTQVEAAQICGVSRRSFQYYEEGDDYQKIEEIIKIIQYNQENRIIGLQFIKQKCTEIFKKYPEIRCAYLYGSYARKEATPESDVDILVVCHKMGLSFFGLACELSDALGKEVDLQTHEEMMGSASFAENVLVEGIKIYDGRFNHSTS